MDTNIKLGLAQGLVLLADYDPRWTDLFLLEEQRIRSALANIVVDVQHVGSTAIPGLTAKPILDIAVGVRHLKDAFGCQVPLASLGYEYAYWAGIEDDYVFGKGVERTRLIHIVEHNGPIWRNYLMFRDALRANPELMQQYAALKEELAQRFPDDRASYTEAKSSFIRRVIATHAAT